MPQGEYPQIDELKQQIKPYEELWNLYAEYKEKYEDAWQKGYLKNLDPEEVESDHKRMMSSANKLTNRFENLKVPKPAKLASEVSKQLVGFRKMLPIIRSLCNPGL
jgi:dynein heavy chain